jgi:hypothetical protein
MPPARSWETPRGAERHALDRAIVAAEQPKLEWLEVGTFLALAGRFLVRTQSGIPDEIAVMIAFPPDYPRNEPHIYDAEDRFLPHNGTRHMFTNGRCCLWLDVASPWEPKDPEGLRMFLDQAAVYFHRQLIFDINPAAGWPGPAWRHDDDAYLDHMLEDWGLKPATLVRLAPGFIGGLGGKDPCPCGSGFQYRRCHQPRIDRFRAKANKALIAPLVKRLLAARADPDQLLQRAPAPTPEKVDDAPIGATAVVRIADPE